MRSAVWLHSHGTSVCASASVTRILMHVCARARFRMWCVCVCVYSEFIHNVLARGWLVARQSNSYRRVRLDRSRGQNIRNLVVVARVLISYGEHLHGDTSNERV